MKTMLTKLAITTGTIIGVVTLITLSTHATKMVNRQYLPQQNTEAKVFSPANYDEALNYLFGRKP